MRTTKYGTKFGKPDYWFKVNEKKGTYEFDCSGFVKYMLLETWPDLEVQGHLDFLPGKNYSGGPNDWMKHVRNLKASHPKHPPRWKLVQLGDKLKKGYILITAKHLMISLGPPDTNGHVLI